MDATSNSHTYKVGAYNGEDPLTEETLFSKPLECGKSYHWHARYLDSNGIWSPWSGDTMPYDDFYVSDNVCSSDAQTWYVEQNMAQSGNGTEWSQAFKTIQEGIDAAVRGRNDIIVVANGKYYGIGNYNINFKHFSFLCHFTFLIAIL